ncbi:serine/threonine-protein kinase [Nostoc sp. 'Peltigera membranacea cyanobiont' 232]|uniref:serine/threonine-protein kinase n=1 Tax=Nostoc sp. 'Peltigera membranacea cyanobiont' 232 TaxID=2014531 RepID=UPI000B956AA2|nr:serine/threonine-protein kinase [Nostoc sp. 'Peltigera membranacea cyanobiont' 232]OYE03517.1 serine/threonine protein kinase [Nostoc sp. 'Peltigera membranacea cyanobiont' 232]
MSLCINPLCPTPNHPNNEQNRFCQSCGSHLELLGRYRVTCLLNDKTGFSKVYKAYEQNTPKILKILKEDLSGNAKAVELFQQEVTVLEQLKHPGIPKQDSYFQYQTRNGLVLHCIAMEKIDGYNLEQWRQQQNRPVSEEQAIAWLKQLLEILNLVHSKHYLHRDIKPSNIMIRSPIEKGWGNLVLIDFGTATEIGRTDSIQLSNSDGMTALMSSGYSAPEQMNAQAVPQSDFFALGRTFIFLLTGQHPLDMYDVQQNVLHWQNHAIDISPLLLNLIDWLIATDIESRPANTQEILQRLEQIEESKKFCSEEDLTPPKREPLVEVEDSEPSSLPLEQEPENSIPPAPVVESQPTETTPENINLAINLNTEQLSAPIPQTLPSPQKEPEEVPLLKFFAGLLVILGLLSIVALAMRNSQFIVRSNYGQSPEKRGNIDYFSYQEGRDRQGKVAEFNIAVLSLEYKWLLGSNFQIKYNDEIISLDLLKLNLEQEDIQNIMGDPSEIISVGTVSCKGNIAVQQRMALERSKQVQFLVKKIFINTPSVKRYRILNLGQFQRSDCQANQDLTKYQRSIIIIGVKKQSEGVILDEALRDRLEKKPFADFKLEDYSLGTAEKFKTIPSNLSNF